MELVQLILMDLPILFWTQKCIEAGIQQVQYNLQTQLRQTSIQHTIQQTYKPMEDTYYNIKHQHVYMEPKRKVM